LFLWVYLTKTIKEAKIGLIAECYLFLFLHLSSGNLNFCQFQAGLVIPPVTKKAEAMN